MSSTLSTMLYSQRIAFSKRYNGEAVAFLISQNDSSGSFQGVAIGSVPNGLYSRAYTSNKTFHTVGLTVPGPMNVVGQSKLLFEFSKVDIPSISTTDLDIWESHTTGLTLPSAARTFVDASAYLWGKDIYMIFVGTGIIFSRTLEEGDFGYLDTTSVLGTITQFGYLDYDESEGTLYLLGQDTTNAVKVAKIVLNTLYDYANDGAWLPMIAADGVPAYIKAKGKDAPVVGDTLTVTVESPKYAYIDGYAVIEFNGQTLGTGTYQYSYPGGSGNFTASVRAINTTTQAITLRVNGSTMATLPKGSTEGVKKSITLGVSSYMASGLTLVLSTT